MRAREPERSPSPASSRGRGGWATTRPRPPGLEPPTGRFGVRVRLPPARRRTPFWPHPRGQRGEPDRGRASWGGGPVLAKWRWGRAALQQGAGREGRRGAGPADHSPKYTVLSHLGHLEAMVGAHSQPASSARARLRAAAAAAPSPPAGLSAHPLAPRPGRGVGSPPSGLGAPDAAGAGAHLLGRTGGRARPARPPPAARARCPLPRPARSSPVSMTTWGPPAGRRGGAESPRAPLTGGVLASWPLSGRAASRHAD